MSAQYPTAAEAREQAAQHRPKIKALAIEQQARAEKEMLDTAYYEIRRAMAYGLTEIYLTSQCVLYKSVETRLLADGYRIESNGIFGNLIRWD